MTNGLSLNSSMILFTSSANCVPTSLSAFKKYRARCSREIGRDPDCPLIEHSYYVDIN